MTAHPRLCLVTAIEPEPDASTRISGLLAASAAATVVLTPPPGSPLDRGVAQHLVTAIQAAGVAVLIADDVTAARKLGADGVHLTWRSGILAAVKEARAGLGPDAIVGADVGRSRHDAMEIGEAGADYVAFGMPVPVGDREAARESRLELVAWWSEIFEVPVVAFDVESAEEAAELARAGTDFIAAAVPSGMSADEGMAWLAALRDALHPSADAA